MLCYGSCTVWFISREFIKIYFFTHCTIFLRVTRRVFSSVKWVWPPTAGRPFSRRSFKSEPGHVRMHVAKKNVVTCGSDRLWTWSERSDLNVSRARSHTCAQICPPAADRLRHALTPGVSRATRNNPNTDDADLGSRVDSDYYTLKRRAAKLSQFMTLYFVH